MLKQAVVVFIGVYATACSPASWLGGTGSSFVAPKAFDNPSTSEKSCSEIDFRNDTFQPRSFRALMGCLNSDGSLNHIQQLIASASDDDLMPLVRVLNEGFFDPVSFRLSDQALVLLKESGLFRRHLLNLARLVEDSDAVTTIVRALDRAMTRAPQIVRRLQDWRSLESLRSGRDREVALDVSSRGLALLKSRAVQTLVRRFSEIPEQRLHAILEATDIPQELIAVFFDEAASGKIDAFARALLSGETPESTLEGVRHASLFFGQIFHQNSSLVRAASEAARSLTPPLTCASIGVRFDDPLSFALSELRASPNLDEFRRKAIVRFGLLLTGGQSFCDFPRPALDAFASIQKLAAGASAEGFYRFLRATAPIDLLLRERILQDPAFLKVIPLLSALVDEALLSDVLFVLSHFLGDAARVPNRNGLLREGASATRESMEWASAIKSVRSSDWSTFLRFAQHQIRQGTWERFIESFQETLQVGDESPLYGLWLRLFEVDERGTSGIVSLVRLSRSASFAPAVREWVGLMESGKLEDLLFRVFALLRQDTSHLSEIPKLQGRRLSKPMSVRLKHDLNSEELERWARLGRPSRTANAYDACIGLATAANEEKFFRCLALDRPFEGLAKAFLRLPDADRATFMRAMKEFWDTLDDRTRLSIFREFRTVRWKDKRGAKFDLTAFATMIRDRVAFERMSRWLEPILADGTWLRALEQTREQASQLGTETMTNRLAGAHTSPAIIERRIREVECLSDASRLRLRARQVTSNFLHGVSNYEIQNGVMKSEWTYPELRIKLASVLDKMNSPAAQAQDRSISSAMANVLSRFGSEYESLSQFLWTRSQDESLVLWYEPGAAQPSVRLMSSLDRLESVLIAGNFSVAEWMPFNFSYRFMGLLAEAWGDEPFEEWPLDIRRKFQAKGRPQTLSEALDEIESTLSRVESLVGYPAPESCINGSIPQLSPLAGKFVPRRIKEHLFNARQVLPVLKENLPRSGGAQQGGLKVLRRLFFELLYSTPESNRSPKYEKENNLSIIVDAVRVGLLRNLSRAMKDVPARHAPSAALANGLTVVARSPLFAPLLNVTVEAQSKRGTLTSYLDKIDPSIFPEVLSALQYFSAQLLRSTRYGEDVAAVDRVLDAVRLAVKRLPEPSADRKKISDASWKAAVVWFSAPAMTNAFSSFFQDPGRLAIVVEWIMKNPALLSDSQNIWDWSLENRKLAQGLAQNVSAWLRSETFWRLVQAIDRNNAAVSQIGHELWRIGGSDGVGVYQKILQRALQ